MYWQNKTVTILGLGRSGLACARELASLGCKLILSDSRPTEALLPLVTDLPEGSYRVVGGGHSSACLDADVIVLSPGVPIDMPIVQAALADGVPVFGEVELAWQLRTTVPYVAITGTNGKTTVTTLIGEILAAGGLKAPVGGNIGTPLVDLVHDDADAIVAEISSFQLETIHDFRPKVAALLNFSDDHLNRHGTREVYWSMKKRIFENQEADDWAVLNADDPQVWSLHGLLRARELPFSTARELATGVFVKDGAIITRVEGTEQLIMPVAEVTLRGLHNLENVLAAVAMAVALGVSPEPIRRTVAAFTGVEHRIEPVRSLDGAQWINDSKGTNYASTVKAIDAYDEPLVLIAGGRDKGGAINELIGAIARRAHHVVLLGEAAPYFERMLRGAGYETIVVADGLAQAVAEARKLARPGDVVLFSPACTSFDMFSNYEERGRAFKSTVQSLADNG